MKFLFDDESFSFEALRAAGYASYSGAELGEVLVTCRNIPEGNDAAWHDEWSSTADRVERLGREALTNGHRISAREALLRASNYFRTADFYRRLDPDHDEESARLASASRRCFSDAAELLDTPVVARSIPYEHTSLPAFLFLVDESGAPRPTVIYHGGYDSTLEENYFALAAGALRRGWNVLSFDGPGQGSALRNQGLHFRPDWEAVAAPAVDHALSAPEVDPERIVLIGTSLGGYLAARAAAFEHRLAACVLHDGVWNFHDCVAPLVRAAQSGPGGLDAALQGSTGLRWAVHNGMWTFGVSSADELVEATRPYSMEAIADQIRCPTLVLDAEADQFFAGQPERIYEALTCTKKHIFFAEKNGGGEHCHEGATSLFHQQTFDWLENILGIEGPSDRSSPP